MKARGSTFLRVVQQIVQPIKPFADSHVDDMTVFSDEWKQHLQHLEKFLETIEASGLTLNQAKCHFAQAEVKFCGHIIGSGKRKADPDKISAVQNMKTPETKTQVRQILGFFLWFREYIQDFAFHAKPLTDLMAKRVPSKIPWGNAEQKAFDPLKFQIGRAHV